MPTGAGKSLVIAELARLARHKILILAHVKELVEQNHDKYESYGLTASIYSAGLKQKSLAHQVTFASVQSISRNLDALNEFYSLVIIDECHRVSNDSDSQYQTVISRLKESNPQLKILGLTATPYRLGLGFCYQFHYHGFVRGNELSPFKQCIFELPLRYMISHQYLTPPVLEDAAIAQYDFSQLNSSPLGSYSEQDLNALLKTQTRATKAIIAQVLERSEKRQGVMIFASTVEHANEILGYLPSEHSAIVVGATHNRERDEIITRFKNKAIKYLVNVSVLTTGFDAPHVDMIAILRPTESVSLYQQIVGRGLRLAENKKDCLVIDYAGNGFDLFYPEVGSKKPNSESTPVQILCPGCGFANTFWGKVDDDGKVIEHYGRRCQGLLEDAEVKAQCDYRFKFKQCDHCGAENDIAARRCHTCDEAIVDPDDKLRDALNLKNAKVIRCSGLSVEAIKESLLKFTYYDEDGAELNEVFDVKHQKVRKLLGFLFAPRTNHKVDFECVDSIINSQHQLRCPDFVIARQYKRDWRVVEKLFDYEGAYRKANQLI